MDENSKSYYLAGRLKGLHELVSILKETVDTQESPTSPVLIRSIVAHVAKDVESIISDLEEEHADHPLVEAASDQHEDLKASISSTSRKAPTMPEAKKQLDAADELMKNLMAFKQQQGYSGDSSGSARK